MTASVTRKLNTSTVHSNTLNAGFGLYTCRQHHTGKYTVLANERVRVRVQVRLRVKLIVRVGASGRRGIRASAPQDNRESIRTMGQKPMAPTNPSTALKNGNSTARNVTTQT